MRNNKKIVTDIYPPERSAEKKAAAPAEPPRIIVRKEDAHIASPRSLTAARAPRKLPRVIRALSLASGAVAVALAAVAAVGLWNFKQTVAESAPALYEQFREAESALRNLETGRAEQSLAGASEEIASLQQKADQYGLLALADFWSIFVPKLKVIPDTLRNAVHLSESAVRFAAGLGELKAYGFQWLTSGEGAAFARSLEGLQANVARIISLSAALQTQETSLGSPFGKNFLKLNADLYRTERFLKSSVAWLRSPEEKHVLVLFQNPSELRPGGGFIGSYADIIFTPDGIREIKVWDIYDPDGQLDLKVVPPKELQPLSKAWGARDANWFFDFPMSAQKVIKFLETSKIYREQAIQFEGAIAMNVSVLETLLKTTGGVSLPEYGVTIESENFLREVQYEVEAGRDNRAGEPKRILKVLAPLLMERLSALRDDELRIAFRDLKNHFENKDIMVYFKDWEMENYFRDLGVAGDVFTLPSGNSDYLAVVGANIAGGKTDAFTAQKIKLSSKIDGEGRIDNFLTIERTHAGENERDPWYRVPNKMFIKVFTARGSRLTYAKGNDAIPEKSLPTYGREYLADEEVKSIEDTARDIEPFNIRELEESGKTVFAGWLITKAGTTEKMELQYENPVKLSLNGAPLRYLFVFEKQSGANTSLDALFEAPTGYAWKESGAQAFNYVNEEPPGRLKIELTLVPNQTANPRMP